MYARTHIDTDAYIYAHMHMHTHISAHTDQAGETFANFWLHNLSMLQPFKSTLEVVLSDNGI